MALQRNGFQFLGGRKNNSSKHSPQHNRFATYIGSSAGAAVCSFLAAGYPLESIFYAVISKRKRSLFNFSSSQKNTKALPHFRHRDLLAFNFNLESGRELLAHLFKNRLNLGRGLESLFKNYIPVSGILTTKNLENYFEEALQRHNTFDQLCVDLFIPCTRLNGLGQVIFSRLDEGRKYDQHSIYHSYAKISQAVAASVGMPGIFTPTKILNKKKEGTYFYDGSIWGDTSEFIATDQGADLVVISNPILPYHYHPSIGSLSAKGFPYILMQSIYQLIYHKMTNEHKHRAELTDLIKTLEKKLSQLDLPDSEKENIISLIIKKTHHKTKTQYIYIQPRPQDYKFFFYDHVSLSRTMLRTAFNIGFRAGVSAIKKHKNKIAQGSGTLSV